MQHTQEEKHITLKDSIGSMTILMLTVACFLVLLWVLVTIVRAFALLGSS